MAGLIQGAFARTLERNRGRFNAMFAQARQQWPQLDAEAFRGYLHGTVAPIVEAVSQSVPDRVDDVADGLYQLSLELIARDLVGPTARHPTLAEGWGELLEALPRHLASAPRVLTASVTNALYNLSVVPGARPEQWVESMRQIAPCCPDVATLLAAGQVLAWRAGLAHFREGALDVCRRLPPRLAGAALGLPGLDSEAAVEAVVGRLRDDPWLRPASLQSSGAERRLRIVARVGAFRGFGGLFVSPPRVSCTEEQFLVSDGEGCWVLTADGFGATFHAHHRSEVQARSFGIGWLRSGPEQHPSMTVSRSAPSRPEVDAAGRVTWDGESQRFQELVGRTSVAANATTLAVTVPLSHSIFLIARSEVPC